MEKGHTFSSWREEEGTTSSRKEWDHCLVRGRERGTALSSMGWWDTLSSRKETLLHPGQGFSSSRRRKGDSALFEMGQRDTILSGAGDLLSSGRRCRTPHFLGGEVLQHIILEGVLPLAGESNGTLSSPQEVGDTNLSGRGKEGPSLTRRGAQSV